MRHIYITAMHTETKVPETSLARTQKQNVAATTLVGRKNKNVLATSLADRHAHTHFPVSRGWHAYTRAPAGNGWCAHTRAHNTRVCVSARVCAVGVCVGAGTRERQGGATMP